MPVEQKGERDWLFDSLKKFGLPKSHFVRKGWEYEIIYKKGKRLRGNGYILIYLKNNLGYNRLGISIHKRIKGAVKRNRIKRIIRESFRLSRHSYPAESDMVIAVRPGFALKSPVEISEDVSLLK